LLKGISLPESQTLRRVSIVELLVECPAWRIESSRTPVFFQKARFQIDA
jgi:hypothetical protein